ncbi:4-hydroxythreonine-4-phosphate dehydrogenase PdxA [Halovulum dunhuangense]|uniref:4-hydroxythreonine-4-phosphate dehydrogenase n=1 Tax=Halovulum dunhuangense TaxID=1505036 RepID=A0A849L3C1_9RHOB|nr:4-hydroxythreonine-4-phosphate dehydrogenase PdxA [Halovulum dunhuangense]NNU80809.1 4-hydroxythreonine-4-phosphate dehydrogenase PdxA [Halovulum dunhuangense]
MIPPVALTMGDPSGIGPEITCKAWERLRGGQPFFVIGDAELYTGCPAERIATPEDAAAVMPRALPVLDLPLAAPALPGRAQPENAAATIESIDRAVAFAQAGRALGVVTNPITKKILVDGAGFAHPGHTEYLAALGGVSRSVMMLAAPELRVVPATIHIALSDVPAALTAPLLRETLEILHDALIRDFGIPAPRIAVAGLNPHAGEGGMMGTEETTLITPLLEALRATGMDLRGPLPADTMFHAAARARYDAALCMYHDQALIPIKTLNFSGGVNVTLGLPFIRTSPDHGTAHDIAGRGMADPDSLIAAIGLASELGQRRRAAR